MIYINIAVLAIASIMALAGTGIMAYMIISDIIKG